MGLIGGSGPVFRFFQPIDIRVDGGETQVLEAGLYTVNFMNDVYVGGQCAANSGHLEAYLGGNWENYITTDADDNISTFWADGNTVRYANGSAPGTFTRLVGVRRY